MFLYKVSRALLQETGDTGAYLRTAAGALTLFGLPPEKYWPYDPSLLDAEPTPFCYTLAHRYRAQTYFQIDSDGIALPRVVQRMKALLARGLGVMFGYTVYFGAEFQARAGAGIPLPIATDLKIGNHALLACGYDDGRVVTNSSTGGATSTGAFLIKNSRGVGWGDQGYGWLPYDYLLKGLASDAWSVVNGAWVNLAPFCAGTTPAAAPAPAAS